MFAPPLETGRSTIGANSTILHGIAASDARVEKLRRANRHRAIERELDAERQYLESVQAAEQRHKAVEREAAIAHHLEAQQTATLRTQKTIQRVHEETPELRQLRRAIQAAQISKARSDQVVERRELSALERQRAVEEDAQMEIARQEELAAERAREAELRERSKMNAAELEAQQRGKEEARLEAYKAFLREKVAIDAVVARVRSEDEFARGERLAARNRAAEYADEFRRQRVDKQAEEAARERDEDSKIAAYMATVAHRQEQTRKVAAEKLFTQNRILQEQSARIAADQRAKEEKERLLAEYYEERRAEALRTEEAERLQKAAEAKEELRRYADLQMRIAAARKAQQKQQEEEFRAEMMRQFADNQAAERESAVERARRRQDYCREIDDLINQRRRLKEAERQRAERDAALALEAAEEKADLIRAEWVRMLQAVPEDLRPFLPKGTMLALERG